MHVFKKILRFISVPFKILFVGALCLCAFYYFSPDEAIRPEVAAALALPVSVPNEQNGAVFNAGILAEGDAYTAGLAILNAHAAVTLQRNAQRSNALAQPDSKQWLGQPRSAVILRKETCNLRSTLCLAAYQTMADEWATLRRDHATLLARYQQLQAFPHFQPPSVEELDSPSSLLAPAAQSARLALIGVALDLTAPATQARGVATLHAESAFWRRLLAEPNATLLLKMMAVALVRQQLGLLSEILLRYPTLADSYPAHFADIAAPLNDAELSLASAAAAEFRTAALIFTRLSPKLEPTVSDTVVNLWYIFSFKQNASINLLHTHYAEWIEAGSISPHQSREYKTKPPKTAASQFVDTDIFQTTNPIGKILASKAKHDLNPYMLRFHDLDGYARLVNTQLHITQAKLTLTQIPAYLAQMQPGQPARLDQVDPYTNAPMVWNTRSATLSAQSHAPGAEKFAPPEIHFK